MAEGFLRSFDDTLEIYSAGTSPEKSVNPYSVKAMKEAGIDISSYKTNDVSDYTDKSFDFVITVCDNARKTCPVFKGKVNAKIHLGFTDPAEARGTEEEIFKEYREVRDEIKVTFRHFYNTKIKSAK